MLPAAGAQELRAFVTPVTKTQVMIDRSSDGTPRRGVWRALAVLWAVLTSLVVPLPPEEPGQPPPHEE